MCDFESPNSGWQSTQMPMQMQMPAQMPMQMMPMDGVMCHYHIHHHCHYFIPVSCCGMAPTPFVTSNMC